MPIKHLASERLRLQPITDADVVALVRHWGDEQVRRYLWEDQPITVEMVSEVVTTSDRDFRNHGYGIWTLRQAADARLVGVCGLRVARNTELVEVLYSLRPRFWRRGYATEAARSVLSYAFDGLKIERVIAAHDKHNAGSESVMRRIGMRPVARPALDRLKSRIGALAADLSFWEVLREHGVARPSSKAFASSAVASVGLSGRP